MKIKVLPESVYSKIAAGEVIDKPASIIRELIDNSIDAESTEIVISLKKGGIEEICVRDNGCGMEKEDLATSILKHSTSKIETTDDLNNIQTMGFRGEALYSVIRFPNLQLLHLQMNPELLPVIKYVRKILLFRNRFRVVKEQKLKSKIYFIIFRQEKNF